MANKYLLYDENSGDTWSEEKMISEEELERAAELFANYQEEDNIIYYAYKLIGRVSVDRAPITKFNPLEENE